MIPLRDNIPSQTYPVVNVTLIALNSVVFLYEVSLGPALDQFIRTFGLVPLKYFYLSEAYPGAILERFLPFFTSMFLHGGWFHVIGNMVFLWIFGDNVEDRLGHFRYLLFYLVCGLAAAGTQVYTNPGSGVPMVGASGAIAGVMGAYFVLYPHARVLTLIPIFLFFSILEIPAILFLGFWFMLQFFSGLFSLGLGFEGGVAWWAHIGGFVTGILFVIVCPKRCRRREYLDEYQPW